MASEAAGPQHAPEQAIKRVVEAARDRRSGLFALFDAPGRPDLARYYHRNCQRAARPTALPARFLVACPHGHLDD